MSLNSAHVDEGRAVLIHAGECILLFCDNVTLEFVGNPAEQFKGSKKGRLYLTTHRMVFTNSNTKDPLLSFSFPFMTLSDMELEQPLFGANYIRGKVRAQPGGGWTGEVKFKLHFKSGGAIEYGQAMLKAAQLASRHQQNMAAAPPAYTPTPGNWYAAPPPAYAADPAGYYGWVPPTNVFPQQPPVNTVYMTDAPPPYPGINGYSGYQPSAGFVPPPASAPGAAAMNGNDAKAAEAAQNAYFDPNNPHYAYVPPPPVYNEPPPSYSEASKKTN